MEVDCMPTRHRSAWRRRWRSSRRLRVAVPIAIPVALALILGIVIASSDGKVPGVRESALGTCASPSASAAPCATTSGVAVRVGGTVRDHIGRRRPDGDGDGDDPGGQPGGRSPRPGGGDAG